jgi:hypothetical protein
MCVCVFWVKAYRRQPAFHATNRRKTQGCAARPLRLLRHGPGHRWLRRYLVMEKGLKVTLPAPLPVESGFVALSFLPCFRVFLRLLVFLLAMFFPHLKRLAFTHP